MYKHALPPGFVLKRRGDGEDEEEEKISMEQLVEEERQALLTNLPPGQQLTKVTRESFLLWKRKKILEKKLAAKKALKKKKGQLASDGSKSGITGKELFTLGSAAERATETDGGEADEGDFNLSALRKSRADAEEASGGGGAVVEVDGVQQVLRETRAMRIDDGRWRCGFGVWFCVKSPLVSSQRCYLLPKSATARATRFGGLCHAVYFRFWCVCNRARRDWFELV
jgi:hypothetical protein